ncbi:MAG: ABC transporter ATP-binding protein [Solirubrobacteraceae bacterium]
MGRRLRASTRLRALALLWQASPRLSVLAVVFVIAEGVLPVLVLVLMGRVTGAIPDAVTFGLSSPQGHRLIVALAVAGFGYALSLMRGPFEDALTAASAARVDGLMQRRLVQAVSAPTGIEHLEDQDVLERLSSARGELLGGKPEGAPMALISLLGDRLTGVLACVVLATFRWWLGLALLVMWLLVRRPLGTRVRFQATRARQASAPLRRSWYLLGLAWRPHAAKEMRVFGLGEWTADRHREEWLRGMEPTWRELRRLSQQVWFAGALVLAGYALAAGVLGWEADHDQISLRTLATMLMMLPATMSAGSITLADISLAQMLAALPDLDALTSSLRPRPGTAPAPSATYGSSAGSRTPAAGAVPLPAAGLPRHNVRFERLGFAYPGRGEPVLRDLDLELPFGHSLGLVGVNGAGKTTLVMLLARMREPTGGAITVDGFPLTRLNERAWQRQVAVVYQDFARFPFSAAENVGLFGDGPPDRDVLARAADRAGATEIIDQLPRGWDTVLSPHYEGGVGLSGGQWQRIALARALYAVQKGARVLVLDEPTAQLDVRAEAAFYDRFLELTAGVTSIVISHRFGSVRRAHRIAVLDGGRIAELGTHEELLAAGGAYAEMFRVQAERFATAPAPAAGESA